jgi:chromosome segregation ATPase
MNKLDEAKINLKEVMDRLNRAVDKKLIHSKNTPALEVAKKVQALQEDLGKVNSELDDKKDEINYLREQNSELQAKIGEAQHESFVLESRNRETSEKIDRVITQVKSYLVERNLL